MNESCRVRVVAQDLAGIADGPGVSGCSAWKINDRKVAILPTKKPVLVVVPHPSIDPQSDQGR